MKPIIRYFSSLRKFCQLSDDHRQLYLAEPRKNFTRRSPLTFGRTVSIINDLPRQTLAMELANFFRFKPKEIVTKSAFCQRRKLIDPAFFQHFFHRTAEQFYTAFRNHRRWKGKHLRAVDGTGQSLPYFPAIGDHFGTHQNQHAARPSTRLLLTHDVLNNIIWEVDFHGQDTAEIVWAYQNVADLPTDAVYIYDRHYASFGLAYLHHRAGSDYLIRMPPEQRGVVANFSQSADNDSIITVKVKQGRAYGKLRELGLAPQLHFEFEARLVKVILDDGTKEILLTSLTDQVKYPHAEFKKLYNQRWGVETTILTLKSYLQLALISATTQPGVEQDLWASFAFYNQQSALVKSCEEEVERQTKHRKYKYRINRNVTAGLIQHFLYAIYLGGPNDWRAKTLVLLKLMPRYTNAYRPNRDNERKRKIMRANDRHIHEKNYRKAM